MNAPFLVELWRGPLVESRHAGTIAVYDADGRAVLTFGDVSAPVYPRSAIKIIQALPLVESGAADRFHLTDAQLSLACASHGGEERHAQTALAMLEAAGLDVPALECGAHWPMHADAAYALAAGGGQPSALHNNCSGKHAGFLCLACSIGTDPRGYVGRDHPVQRFVAEAIAEVTGHPLDGGTACGTDGCSIPTFAIPLKNLAIGFAKLGADGFAPERNRAARRLRQAVAKEPFMVAGTGRFCTRVMDMFGERVFVKTGAEGVFCATFPEQGLGVALKCADGATRAAEVMMAALIRHYVPLRDKEAEALAPVVRPTLTNWNGITVGHLAPATPLG